MGDAEEHARRQAEKEREQRVELLGRQAMRRMLNSALADGWSAWHELWSAKTYAMGRLREVANRLKSPALSTAFGEWVAGWEDSKREAEMKAHLRSAAGLQGERTALEDELQVRARTHPQLDPRPRRAPTYCS